MQDEVSVKANEPKWRIESSKNIQRQEKKKNFDVMDGRAQRRVEKRER
jgi:replication initiation and membrane attachment protein DnaB